MKSYGQDSKLLSKSIKPKSFFVKKILHSLQPVNRLIIGIYEDVLSLRISNPNITNSNWKF